MKRFGGLTCVTFKYKPIKKHSKLIRKCHFLILFICFNLFSLFIIIFASFKSLYCANPSNQVFSVDYPEKNVKKTQTLVFLVFIPNMLFMKLNTTRIDQTLALLAASISRFSQIFRAYISTDTVLFLIYKNFFLGSQINCVNQI